MMRCTVVSPMPVPGKSEARVQPLEGAEQLRGAAMSNPAPLSLTKIDRVLFAVPALPTSISAAAVLRVNFHALFKRFSRTMRSNAISAWTLIPSAIFTANLPARLGLAQVLDDVPPPACSCPPVSRRICARLARESRSRSAGQFVHSAGRPADEVADAPWPPAAPVPAHSVRRMWLNPSIAMSGERKSWAMEWLKASSSWFAATQLRCALLDAALESARLPA